MGLAGRVVPTKRLGNASYPDCTGSSPSIRYVFLMKED